MAGAYFNRGLARHAEQEENEPIMDRVILRTTRLQCDLHTAPLLSHAIRMKNIKSSFWFIALALSSVLLTGCQGAPAAITTLAPPISPAPTQVSSPVLPGLSPVPATLEASTGFQARQFDPAAPFFQSIRYPDELTSISEKDLVRMRCSPEYFSWSGADHEYVDATTMEHQKLVDPVLQAYLKSAQDLNPGKRVTSLSACKIEKGKTIVVYRVGSCGGGCAGVPHLSYGDADGSLESAIIILPAGDGAYFGCRVSQLTTHDILYATCLGEGTGIIRKIDLQEHSVSVLISCRAAESGVNCRPD